jgi:hypothetical protein
MSVPTAPSDDPVSLTQIWAALNTDLQARVIQLLGQLAFNLLTTQTASSINKEAFDAITSDQSQNPS